MSKYSLDKQAFESSHFATPYLCFAKVAGWLLDLSNSVASSSPSLLPIVRGTIERYKKASAASSNTESVSEANTQFYQQESSKLRRQIRDIQNLNRHILGEALSSLSLKELKNLESRLEKGLSRVRSRKV
ncbi:hypothetical protein S245_066867 [Arachis hypogaea]